MAPLIRSFIVALVLLLLGSIHAADYPAPLESDYIIKNFKFSSGDTLPELRIHYRTVGNPAKDDKGAIKNAVLIIHGTTGSGAQFIRPEFAGELFGPSQPLDASKFFIILPDGIGHGKSTKPSDGMHARFPQYGYLDMIEADYRLLTDGLSVNHARLIMGTSMGGMHSWLWGELHPDFMDALMPLASLPTQISGRNRAWRRMIIDAIRHDPEWHGGDYSAQPQSLRTVAEMLWFMSSNPVSRQKDAPTLAKTDEVLDKFVAEYFKTGDANDALYALEASHDYDPGPNLEKIRAPLLAINSADDLINPPELGILEREIKRVPKGRAVVIPLSEETRGHGSHTMAALWKAKLEQLLKESENKGRTSINATCPSFLPFPTLARRNSCSSAFL
jgi:homoserine O-acetyltransferase